MTSSAPTGSQQLDGLTETAHQPRLRSTPRPDARWATVVGRPASPAASQRGQHGEGACSAEPVSRRRGDAHRLTHDQHHLAAQQVGLLAKLHEVVGVLDGGGLQSGVRQCAGPRPQLRDLVGQVEAFGAHEHLHRGRERVQVTAEARDQAFLLGRCPQREVHRAGNGDDGQTVGAQVDDAGVGDRFGGQPQRGWRDLLAYRHLALGRRALAVPRGPARGRGGLGGQPVRCWPDAFGRGDAVAWSHALADRGNQEPVQRDAVTLAKRKDRRSCPDGDRQRDEHRDGHNRTGGGPDRVEHEAGHGQDPQLAGG